MGCGGSVPDNTPILVEENIIDTMGRLKASLEAHHRENDNEDEANYDSTINDSSTSEEGRMGLYSAVLAHQFMTKRVVERDDSTTTKETSVAEDFILRDNATESIVKREQEQTKIVLSQGDKLDDLVLSDILETPNKSNPNELESDSQANLANKDLGNINEETSENNINNQNESLDVPKETSDQEPEAQASVIEPQQTGAVSASTDVVDKESVEKVDGESTDKDNLTQDLKDNESANQALESESPILNSGSTNVPMSPTRSNSVGSDPCVENPMSLLHNQNMQDKEETEEKDGLDKEQKTTLESADDNNRSVSLHEDNDSA